MTTNTQVDGSQIPTVGIGLLGTSFMAKAHSLAYKTMPIVFWPPPANPQLVAIAGRDRSRTREAARRYGYRRSYDDWRALLDDGDVQLFDNVGSNDVHAEASIAAAEAGKHVLCEKPLARTTDEARSMLRAVERADVLHGCMFVYRFVPALRLARQLVTDGALGRVRQLRIVFLQDWLADADVAAGWRVDRQIAGSGAIGDLGSHVVDLARYLVGEPVAVSGMTRTFVPQRAAAPGSDRRVTVDVDDAFAALIDFENGALGTLEATRVARGHRSSAHLEINGERGSLAFDLERLNELHVNVPELTGRDSPGFATWLMTEPTHPYLEAWWPPGFPIGWSDLFVHLVHDFCGAIATGGLFAPHGATFEDGYRAAVICDAIATSGANGGERVEIRY